MKLVRLPAAPDELDPDVDPGVPGDYVLSFPVPGPDVPGRFVFLPLTPDGRQAAVMVDEVFTNDHTVKGFLAGEHVVTVPREAPWILLRRDLLRHKTKAEMQGEMQRTAEAYRGLLSGGAGRPCTVHGVVHGDDDALAAPTNEAADKPAGQYL